MAHSRILIFFLLLALLLHSVAAYEQLNTRSAYDTYVEVYSAYPTLHIYYNRHFSKMHQFEDFLEVIEDVELKVEDYAKIIMTDCEVAKDENFESCDSIKRHNENRMIIGMKPSDTFLKLGGKKLQRSAAQVTYNHPSDIYNVPEIVTFIDGLLPSYLQRVSVMEELDNFLKTRYSPKVLYFTKEEDVPENIKKLAVFYDMRIDFAYVEDLSEDIVIRYNIKNFPSILVLSYDYSKSAFVENFYEGSQFDFSGYVRMKAFLEPYALKEPRNDVMFHSIKPITKAEIHTVENHEQLWKIYDRAPTWTLTFQGQSPQKLVQMSHEYGPYFQYVHKIAKDVQTEAGILSVYDPSSNMTFRLQGNKLDFQPTDQQGFIGNLTVFLRRNYTVLAVRQKYSHLCTVTSQSLFRGLSHCIIIGEEHYPAIRNRINSEFEYGIVVYAGEKDGQTAGQPIRSASFQDVYRPLQYFTKVTLQKTMNDFLKNPVKQLTQEDTLLREVCFDPYRKCVVAILDTNKKEASNTELGYLKDIAQNYFSEFSFYWVPLRCNEHVAQQLDAPKMTLFVYDGGKNTFSPLKKRLTKPLISKFLKKSYTTPSMFRPLPVEKLYMNYCVEGKEL